MMMMMMTLSDDDAREGSAGRRGARNLEPSRAISSSESPPWLAISPRSQVLTISVALGTAIPLGIFARLLASCQALGTCYKVWRTGCHMLSRHLEAIEHLWFEIRDKHWGSGSSFKKGHRARISGECEVDASVLLQATEESHMLSSEAAVKEEVERACTEPDAPLPCMHTLTTAPFRESLHRTRRAPAVHAYAHDGALSREPAPSPTRPCRACTRSRRRARPPHRSRRLTQRAFSERGMLGRQRASMNLWCTGASGERLMSPECD